MPEEAGARWLAIRPGTDTALMLGLMHTLVAAGLHDRAFLERFCDGWAVFEDYLMGRGDGQPKSAAWAAPLCEIEAGEIVALARGLPGRRVLVTVSHSLQRAEYGEQPVWAGAVLAAVLGQIGLPGGGYAYALGTLAHYGKRSNLVPVAALSQGTNGVKDFIPVARIADMLLHPGSPMPTTARQGLIRTSGWRTGPEAIPSIITRIWQGWPKRSAGWILSSCTKSPGPPRPATRTSSCPAP